MGKNIFVSVSPVPPARWQMAFPQAEVLSSKPSTTPADSIIWLHNMLPDDVRQNGVRFVVMHDEPNDDKGLEALAHGASGYCNAHATPELLKTIESVIRNNGLWVGESLLNRLVGGIGIRSAMTGRHEQHPALQVLSEREREVALCVARGESNKEITRNLDIAERTIKAHLTSIFEKLGVRDRLQLAILLNTAG
ncbi:MAG: response regulator transcription factor [Nitrosomonadales bacterium]|nr:response regulator transcription factor [Nitrosomonadales bacterium]